MPTCHVCHQEIPLHPSGRMNAHQNPLQGDLCDGSVAFPLEASSDRNISGTRDAVLGLRAAQLCAYQRDKHGPFKSAHEGYAVLLEEVDGLKELVWRKRELRDPRAMAQECTRIAAMALRFSADLCEEGS